MDYLVYKRNQNNSKFKVCKKISKNWIWLSKLFTSQTLNEKDILKKMRLKHKFWVMNPINGEYTQVIKWGKHIRSEPNKVIYDNLNELPTF